MLLKEKISRTLINLPGWHTKRKIVVIESDDWGSIRMPSREVYEKLLKAGIRVDKCPYNRYDSLASEDDLSALFETLNSVKDKNDNPAVITANAIVANPDFEKIRESGFQEYFYEPFTETLNKYPQHKNSFKLWKQGMAAGCFHPQFHGREHVNIYRWLKALQENLPETKLAFDYALFGISSIITKENRKNYMQAFAFDTEEEKKGQGKIIRDGLELFEKLFGYKSKSFIAPAYTWHPDLEFTLKEKSVNIIQSNPFQKIPVLNSPKFKKKIHYTGQKNKYNQTYLIRNAYFEPTLLGRNNVVEDCLQRIEIAFKMNKPAVIGSHRLNFIGYIDNKNRDRNLFLLKRLLKEIVKKWSNVEFVNLSELSKLIK